MQPFLENLEHVGFVWGASRSRLGIASRRRERPPWRFPEAAACNTAPERHRGRSLQPA
jgi:hypothetical protein